ncbi:zf-TFIIB domain-containing protein [Rhodospirillaceae bacterium SYSU D60014]|jgi:uncharacterized protein|uniref:TFIIB-type zinc ribbon-containing protein n=1 Tax=Virgifigura deserti TaxID=2268457 RepID=UPI000E663C47
MQCPIDKVDLVMTDRQGIEIDYCPKCRGVWLDRGELDKIIERSAENVQQPAAAPQPREYQQGYQQDYRGSSHGKPHYKKRKSLLGEIFDF